MTAGVTRLAGTAAVNEVTRLDLTVMKAVFVQLSRTLVPVFMQHHSTHSPSIDGAGAITAAAALIASSLVDAAMLLQLMTLSNYCAHLYNCEASCELALKRKIANCNAALC
jgi:hypothetical protein